MPNLVRVARHSDIKRVFELQRHFLKKFAKRDLAAGFFTKAFSVKQLSAFLRDPKKILLVYGPKNPTSVHGFVTGYFGKKVYSGSKVTIYDSFFRKLVASGNYAFIERVAKWESASAFAPVRIYQKFHEEAKQRGFKFVLGQIAIDPPNTPSLSFHRDYVRIGEYVDTKTRVKWGIFAKKLTN